MAYNPIHPKESTIFPDNEQFQPGHAIDTTLIHRLTNFPFVTKFYGTDSHGERDGYLSTINRAMKDRVVTPINECLGQKRKYFFKPYNSAPQLLYNSIHGYFLTSNAYYASMGMLSNSLFTLSMLCLPAVIELVSGITSLLSALYHLTIAKTRNDRAELTKAKEFCLDATTRLVLVIPLAAVSIASIPFEIARFFTKTISILTKVITEIDLSESRPSQRPTVQRPRRATTTEDAKESSGHILGGRPLANHRFTTNIGGVRTTESRPKIQRGEGPRGNIHTLASL